MKLGFRRGEKGFTLIEIIIVLAVLGVLSAIVVPNVQGFLGQGKERSYSTDQKILQAAVDGWRTDKANRKDNKWPTIGGQSSTSDPGGTIGTPSHDADGDFTGSSDNNTFIDIALLATGGFIKSSDTVTSFAREDTYVGTTNTNSGGSYFWFVNNNGVVDSWYPTDATDTFNNGALDVDDGELGYQTGVYP